MWQPQGFYNQYVLRSPVILTGEKSMQGLYNYPSVKIAVIHGKSFSDRELFDLVFAKRSLRFIERSWKNEPDFEGLKDTIAQLEEYRPDTIIAVGGGSVIDGSKLCRLLYEFPYYKLSDGRISGDLLKTKFIAIPTTVGSGSEVSSAAVFVNHETRSKDMIIIHELQPDVIVYDKRYVENSPTRLLVASSLDAMAHILEGYVSKNENAFLDLMAEKGLSVFHDELQKLVDEKFSSINYDRLQYAGYIGGMVQNHCIVGAAHAIAHQLAFYGYSHAESVALLLPAVILSNAQNDDVQQKYEKISNSSGFDNYLEMTNFLRVLSERFGICDIKTDLKNLLNKLLKDNTFVENVKNDKGGRGNPVDITDEYIAKISEMV